MDMRITVVISKDGLGLGPAFDVDKSFEKYAEQLLADLKTRFPLAEIEVKAGLMNSYTIEPKDYQDNLVETVTLMHMAENVWQTFTWLVNKQEGE